MAYHDALFQLGMDLTRSSTAQKEEFGEAAQAAHENRTPVRRYVRRSVPLARRGNRAESGNHLIVDLHGASGLNDLARIEDALMKCARITDGEPLNVHLHRDASTGGVSGVVVLADSHISFHSWPEEGYAALDVFVRGEAQSKDCLALLKAAFSPSKVEVKTRQRSGSMGKRLLDAAADAKPHVTHSGVLVAA